MKKTQGILMSAVLVVGVSLGFWGARHLGSAGNGVEPQGIELSGEAHPEAGDHTGHDHAKPHEESILDWCAEHRVPESACTKCNPALEAKFKEAGDWCAGHGLPESHCRLCNPEIKFPQEIELAHNDETEDAPAVAVASVFFRSNAQECATNDALIQFASSKTLERAGLTVEPAVEAPVASFIEAPAEAVFDQTQTISVSTTVPATVTAWLARPGETVKSGDIIARLTSPEMPQLKADYIEAHSEAGVMELEFKRQENLHEANLISQEEYQKGRSAWEMAKARLARAEGLLLAAGLSHEDLEKILSERAVDGSFTLRAAANGEIMKAFENLGELAPAGASLATISNTSAVWIEAYAKEAQVSKIKPGQRLEFVAGVNGAGRSVGEIIWVSQFLEPGTRTAKVRAKILSDSRTVRPGEFGRALIYTENSRPAVMVPKDAVQWEGCCNVVFVQESPERFRPRKVTIDTADEEHYKITSGLAGGEQVVVHGSYLLKTELMKSSLGTGCCGLEPGA